MGKVPIESQTSLRITAIATSVTVFICYHNTLPDTLSLHVSVMSQYSKCCSVVYSADEMRFTSSWLLAVLDTGCSTYFNDIERNLKLSGAASNCSLLLWRLVLLFPARMNTWLLACWNNNQRGGKDCSCSLVVFSPKINKYLLNATTAFNCWNWLDSLSVVSLSYSPICEKM